MSTKSTNQSNSSKDNILSYAKIMKDIQMYKRSGTSNGDEFNILDTPSQKYFKIFFHFGSKNEFGNGDGCGFLAPTWNNVVYTDCYVDTLKDDGRRTTIEYKFEDISDKSGKATGKKRWNDYKEIINDNEYYDVSELYNYNSAWSYLMQNDELERAERLEDFVNLLSNINSMSPWYFTSISGLNEAIERKGVDDPKYDMSERRKLTITCLPDAFDNRIGTLLDLYRSITWSWTQKREVVPSNLRKFDMSIYIFETPEAHWHFSEKKLGKRMRNGFVNSINSILGGIKNDLINISDDDGPFIGAESKYGNPCNPWHAPSYKMLEFHDCEFSYNSAKSGLNEINNQTGIQPTYTIEISYGDCYEVTYNDITMKLLGDVIITDTAIASFDDSGVASYYNYMSGVGDNLYYDKHLSRVMNPYKENWGKKIADQLVTELSEMANDTLKRAAMGNLFGFSLTSAIDQVKDVVNGNLLGGIKTAADYAKTWKERANVTKQTNNIYGNFADNWTNIPGLTAVGDIYNTAVNAYNTGKDNNAKDKYNPINKDTTQGNNVKNLNEDSTPKIGVDQVHKGKDNNVTKLTGLWADDGTGAVGIEEPITNISTSKTVPDLPKLRDLEEKNRDKNLFDHGNKNHKVSDEEVTDLDTHDILKQHDGVNGNLHVGEPSIAGTTYYNGNIYSKYTKSKAIKNAKGIAKSIDNIFL